MRLLCILEVFLGAGILLVSIWLYYCALAEHENQMYEENGFSRFIFGLCLFLMIFFLLGYVALGSVYLSATELEVSDILTSTIVFFGSVFVLVTIAVLKQMTAAVKRKTDETIRTLVTAVEAKDCYTRGHSVHVAQLTEIFYNHLPLHLKNAVNYADLTDAAILHDIGKIGIPDSILKKPGRLSEEEMAVVRRHPGLGKYILEQTSFRHLGDIILYHHERMDRQGYYRAAPDTIPMESRIIAIADTFSALYSDRVYRPRKSFEEAMRILSDNAGTQFDRELVRIFTAIPAEEIDGATGDLFEMESPQESWMRSFAAK